MSKYDEVINDGPFSLKRKGRSVIMENNLSAEDIENAKQNMKVSFPSIKKRMHNLLFEIEVLILDNFNPLDALGFVTTENLIVNPNEYVECESNKSQLEVEIIQNIVLKNKPEKYHETSAPEHIGKLFNLLDEFQSVLRNYLIYDNLLDETSNEIEKEIRFKIIGSFLIIRGDAFPLHYKRIALELFSDFRLEKVLKKYGFTIDEYFQTVEEIDRQSIAFMKDKTSKTKERCDDFLRFIEDNFKESDDFSTSLILNRPLNYAFR
ncbi:hypothetical protein [uncultured Methanolobus sp.]|uniref:hypothetical protein n=1 Tax=uncultured Methanolobus sp. TaxID=218300 RepID=UPI0029C882F4|nr:hypothetical protein [uncultured Methanolobus sp.]